MTETTSSRGFSRRSFIKGVAALTAAGALAGCTPKEDDKQQVDPTPVESPDQIFAGVCRGNCYSGCFLNVHVRDGQVVRTSARDMPNKAFNRICPKGLTHPHRIYSSVRLQYPMKRIGERGKGEFERISWEEAMGTIIEKWNGYVAEYGPSSFAMYTGSGNYGAVTGSQSFGSPYHRFINASGCSFINFNVDLAALGTTQMIQAGFGVYSGNMQTRMSDSDVIFVWCNPVESQPHNMHFILDAIESGTKVVVVDPRFTYLAGKAHKFVPVEPATDSLLCIAMIKTILEKGWENVDFIRKHTTSPFLVKESDGLYLKTSDLDPSIPPEEAKECVLAEDGQIVAYDQVENVVLEGSLVTENGLKVNTAYTLLLERLAGYDVADCSEKCGISVEDIEELADLFANGGNVGVEKNPGATHYSNGPSVYGGINTLMVLTGQIGAPGKGMVGGMSSGGTFDVAGTSLMLDPEAPGGAFGFHQYMGHGLDVLVMDKVMENNEFAGKEVHLKGMFIAQVNPLVAASDHNYMVDWFNKVEFIVVADMNMNETARYADILLPVAHWFEEEDVFNLFANHPYALFQDKAIEPLYEARTDFEILKELAEGIGIGKYFDMTAEEYVDMALNTDVAKAAGITFASMKEKKVIDPLNNDDYVHLDNCVFGTPYNRVSTYQDSIAPMGNSGQPFDHDQYRMVYWEPATEVFPGNPKREEFPYVLITPHSRFRTHSQWWEVQPLKELDGELKIRVCPADAQAIGISEGDLVKVRNDRGYAVLPAVITAGLPSGVVSVDGCWEDSEMREGVINALTGHHSDPFIRDTAFYDAIVAIEKVS